jgi:thioredoxin 1
VAARNCEASVCVCKRVLRSTKITTRQISPKYVRYVDKTTILCPCTNHVDSHLHGPVGVRALRIDLVHSSLSAGRIWHLYQTFEAFDRHVQVFVDFFAEWCGPCKMVAPKLDELSQKYPHVTFLKVDVDSCQDLAKEHGVSAMPTFVAFLNGEKVDTVVGADLGKIEALITKCGPHQE